MKKIIYVHLLFSACLTLLSPAVNAVTGAKVSFNLKAVFNTTTCDTKLYLSGANGDESVYFPPLFIESEKSNFTQKMSILLFCGANTSLPMAMGIGFMPVIGTVSPDTTGRLYPDGPEGPQTNLYLDWRWPRDITKIIDPTPNASGGFGGETPVAPGPVKLGLPATTDINVIKLAGIDNGVLEFPIEITRGALNSAVLSEGEYTAVVNVEIVYM